MTSASVSASTVSKQIKLFYVQAHGGGTNSLKNVITTFNNYISSNRPLNTNDIISRGSGFINGTQMFPMIGRLVSPGKSANSSFDSDKQTVNYIRNILSSDNFRQSQIPANMTTRSCGGTFTQGDGYRRIGELKNNISFYCANDPIFNETVEVELIGNMVFGGEEDAKGDPGGFGIWKCGGDVNGWEYLKTYTDDILLSSIGGDSKDIQILEIVRQLTALFGKNIIVIFPNCSPFGVESWTSQQRREVRNPGMKGWTIEQQFQQTLLMLSRIQNFYEGNFNFINLIKNGPQFTIDCQKHEEFEYGIDGPIGVMDKDDSRFLYSVLTNFIKKYPVNNNVLDSIRTNEMLYINSIFNDGSVDLINFVYLILLLSFTVSEIYGGIFRDIHERLTLTNLKREINTKMKLFLSSSYQGNEDRRREINSIYENYKGAMKEIEYGTTTFGAASVAASFSYGLRINAWQYLKAIAKKYHTVSNRGGESKSAAPQCVDHPTIPSKNKKELLSKLKQLATPRVDHPTIPSKNKEELLSKLKQLATPRESHGGVKRTRKKKRRKKKRRKKKTNKKRKTKRKR